MTLRVFVVAFVLTTIAACQCGPSSMDPCEGVQCASPLVCNPDTGRCAGLNANTGGGTAVITTDAGAHDAGTACAQSCSGVTPLCDEATGRCVTCTASSGCGGATPVCQTISNGGLGKCVVCTVNEGCSGATPACDPTVFPNGACVQCTRPDDCPVPGSDCDLSTNRCVPGGSTGGGAGGGGGGSVQFDDAGMTARCLPLDAGVVQCTSECGPGYECVSGVCRLRGSSGPVQVTLRFPDPEDLDLHLVEPLPDGGTCEIYYAMPGVNPTPPIIPIPIPVRQCGAKGWLDVDSNAACDIDNINVENIIYSPGVSPTGGRYTVRVVYYQHCSVNRAIPYEVEVRANGSTRWYCGQFQPGDANGGNQGAGVHITDFTLN